MPRLRVDSSPLWFVRLRARGPRIAVLATAVLLSAGGFASALVSPDVRVSRTARSGDPDAAARGIAQEFARVYLSWDPRDPGRREARLARFGSALAGTTAESLGGEAHEVLWTAVVGASKRSSRRDLVTVAVDDGTRRTYLAVTVARDRAGRRYVAGPPAIVGPPAIATREPSDPQLEADDRELRAVCSRVVRNYLARERDDLVADLEPRVVVSLPARPMRVTGVEAITWVAPRRRVAIAVVARARGGLRLSLRYELDVVRDGRRWLVRAVHVNPVDREVS